MTKRKFSLQNFEGGRALSREEMKNVFGGLASAAVKCTGGCTGSVWNSKTFSMDPTTGNCTLSSMVMNGNVFNSCDCSAAGATTSCSAPA